MQFCDLFTQIDEKYHTRQTDNMAMSNGQVREGMHELWDQSLRSFKDYHKT